MKNDLIRMNAARTRSRRRSWSFAKTLTDEVKKKEGGEMTKMLCENCLEEVGEDCKCADTEPEKCPDCSETVPMWSNECDVCGHMELRKGEA